MSDHQKTEKKFDFRNILILIIATSFSFLIGEYILRQMTVTDRLGFERVSSVEKRAFAAPVAKQRMLRIVGIGDSFTIFRDTQGRNYLRYAEKKISKAGSSGIDVINLAQAGTNLHEYFKNIALYGERLRPDIVTIGLYLGNDISRPGELSLKQKFEVGELMQKKKVKEKNLREVLTGWAKNSILLNFIFRQLKVYVPALRSGAFEDLIDYLKKYEGKDDKFVQKRLNRADPRMVELAKSDAINVWDLASAIFHPDHYVNLYDIPPGSLAERNLSKMLIDLDFVISWLLARDMKPIVILLHPSIIVGKEYQEYYKRLGYSLPDLETKTTPLTDRITEHLLSREIVFLDTLSLLRSTKGNLYIPDDTHLNSKGQRVVGEALYELIESNKMLSN